MMKIAVFSDIHSNFTAFKACVDHALSERADAFIFLGDYVTDNAFPRETLELMYALKREYQCRFVLGNRDGDMLAEAQRESESWFPGSGCGALYYSYHELTKKDFEFFGSLPFCDEVQFGALPPLLLCHGSPASVAEPIREENARAWLEKLQGNILLCGHTHLQNIFPGESGFIFNAGSVGFQLDGDNRAKMGYLISDGKRWRPVKVKLEYDFNAELKRLRQSGLYETAPVWTLCTERALKAGEDMTLKCLERVKALNQGGGWPYPEEAWRQAEKELF